MFRQVDSDRGIHILVYAIHDLTLSSRVADFATQRVEDAFRDTRWDVLSAPRRDFLGIGSGLTVGVA
jgi:hypothetical protein